MTLEIRRGKLPSELISIVHAEYSEKTGTAVIDVPNFVEVQILEPSTAQASCDNPQHGVKAERYFDAKEVKRYGPEHFRHFPAPRLEGTLLGQDGSADFVLYY